MTSILPHSDVFSGKLLRSFIDHFHDQPAQQVAQIASSLDRCIECNAISAASTETAKLLVECVSKALDSISPPLHFLGLKLAASIALSLPGKEYAKFWNDLVSRMVKLIKEEEKKNQKHTSFLAQCFTTCAALLHSAAPICRFSTQRSQALKLTESLARLSVAHLPESLPLVWACCAITPRELRFTLAKLNEKIRFDLFFHNDSNIRQSAASLFVYLIIALPENSRAETMRSCVSLLCQGLEDVSSILDVFTSQSSSTQQPQSLEINRNHSSKLPNLHQPELAVCDEHKLIAFFDSVCTAVSCCLTSQLTNADLIQVPLYRLVSSLNVAVAPRSIDPYASGLEESKLDPDGALNVANFVSITGLHTLRKILQAVDRSILLPLQSTFCEAARSNLQLLVLQSQTDHGLVSTSLLRKSTYEFVADSVVVLGAPVLDAILDLLRRLLGKEIRTLILTLIAKRQDNFLYLSGSDIVADASYANGGLKKKYKRSRLEAGLSESNAEEHQAIEYVDDFSFNKIQDSLDAGMRVVKACFDCRGFVNLGSCKQLRNIEKLILECFERGVASNAVIAAATAASAGGGSNRMDAYISPLFEPYFRAVTNIPISALNSMDIREAAASGRAVCSSILYPKGPPIRPSAVSVTPSLYIDPNDGSVSIPSVPQSTSPAPNNSLPTPSNDKVKKRSRKKVSSRKAPALTPTPSPKSTATEPAQVNVIDSQDRNDKPDNTKPTAAPGEKIHVIKGVGPKFNQFVFNVRRDAAKKAKVQSSDNGNAKHLNPSDNETASPGQVTKEKSNGSENHSNDENTARDEDIVMKSTEETANLETETCVQSKAKESIKSSINVDATAPPTPSVAVPVLPENKFDLTQKNNEPLQKNGNGVSGEAPEKDVVEEEENRQNADNEEEEKEEKENDDDNDKENRQKDSNDTNTDGDGNVGDDNVGDGNVGDANVNVGDANVNVGNANVNVGDANVNVGDVNVNVGDVNVNVGDANVNGDEVNDANDDDQGNGHAGRDRPGGKLSSVDSAAGCKEKPLGLSNTLIASASDLAESKSIGNENDSDNDNHVEYYPHGSNAGEDEDIVMKSVVELDGTSDLEQGRGSQPHSPKPATLATPLSGMYANADKFQDNANKDSLGKTQEQARQEKEIGSEVENRKSNLDGNDGHDKILDSGESPDVRENLRVPPLDSQTPSPDNFSKNNLNESDDHINDDDDAEDKDIVMKSAVEPEGSSGSEQDGDSQSPSNPLTDLSTIEEATFPSAPKVVLSQIEAESSAGYGGSEHECEKSVTERKEQQTPKDCNMGEPNVANKANADGQTNAENGETKVIDVEGELIDDRQASTEIIDLAQDNIEDENMIDVDKRHDCAEVINLEEDSEEENAVKEESSICLDSGDKINRKEGDGVLSSGGNEDKPPEGNGGKSPEGRDDKLQEGSDEHPQDEDSHSREAELIESICFDAPEEEKN